MTEYTLVPATREHAVALAPHVRKPDADEVWAAGHLTPLEALYASLRASRNAQAALVGGEVVCMFGIGTVSLLSDLGVPWLLGSGALEKHARAFLRGSRIWLAAASEEFPRMRNHVDARNTVAIRWLKWAGFAILPAQPFGIDQLPFHPFELGSL